MKLRRRILHLLFRPVSLILEELREQKAHEKRMRALRLENDRRQRELDALKLENEKRLKALAHIRASKPHELN
jgi:hypothetical protein